MGCQGFAPGDQPCTLARVLPGAPPARGPFGSSLPSRGERQAHRDLGQDQKWVHEVIGRRQRKLPKNLALAERLARWEAEGSTSESGIGWAKDRLTVKVKALSLESTWNAWGRRRSSRSVCKVLCSCGSPLL